MDLEICVDSIESARAAEQGGAQRIEVCSDLLEGGITPSLGLLKVLRATVAIPIFVMVRPRGGDFCYSVDEFTVMKTDIAQAKDQGADGVVLGILHPDGRVDQERTRELVELSRPMQVTFHRAIDVASDINDALEGVISTGAERVLTSGGEAKAIDAIDLISRLVVQAAGRIKIMACGGVREQNLDLLVQKTGARDFHASLRREVQSPLTYHPQPARSGFVGLGPFVRYAVSPEEVARMRRVLDGYEDR